MTDMSAGRLLTVTYDTHVFLGRSTDSVTLSYCTEWTFAARVVKRGSTVHVCCSCCKKWRDLTWLVFWLQFLQHTFTVVKMMTHFYRCKTIRVPWNIKMMTHFYRCKTIIFTTFGYLGTVTVIYLVHNIIPLLIWKWWASSPFPFTFDMVLFSRNWSVSTPCALPDFWGAASGQKQNFRGTGR